MPVIAVGKVDRAVAVAVDAEAGVEDCEGRDVGRTRGRRHGRVEGRERDAPRGVAGRLEALDPEIEGRIRDSLRADIRVRRDPPPAISGGDETVPLRRRPQGY